jgi:hypothetical protein
MAGTLKRLKVQSVATGGTDLTTGTETGPPATKVWNIPRLYICNRTTAIVKIDVAHKTGATATYLASQRDLAGNDTIILENIVLLNGDLVNVLAGTATAVDVFGSIIEEDA